MQPGRHACRPRTWRLPSGRAAEWAGDQVPGQGSADGALGLGRRDDGDAAWVEDDVKGLAFLMEHVMSQIRGVGVGHSWGGHDTENLSQWREIKGLISPFN